MNKGHSPKETVANCPFCGSSTAPDVFTSWEIENAEDRDDEGHPESFSVCCDFHNDGCGAMGGYSLDKGDAIARWNRRAGS